MSDLLKLYQSLNLVNVMTDVDHVDPGFWGFFF